MAGHEEESADHYRLSIPEFLIRDPTPNQWRRVDKHQVIRKQSLRVVDGPAEPLASLVAHVEREHRNHGVEAEALPHLCREKNVKARWMLLPAGFVSGHLFGSYFEILDRRYWKRWDEFSQMLAGVSSKVAVWRCHRFRRP